LPANGTRDVHLDLPAGELLGYVGPDLGEEVHGALGGGDSDSRAEFAAPLLLAGWSFPMSRQSTRGRSSAPLATRPVSNARNSKATAVSAALPMSNRRAKPRG
jgi:hypothetical protein